MAGSSAPGARGKATPGQMLDVDLEALFAELGQQDQGGEGLTMREISQTTGRSIHTCRGLIYKAINAGVCKAQRKPRKNVLGEWRNEPVYIFKAG